MKSAASTSERRAVLLGAAALVLAGVLAYANSFRGPFVFDDVLAIAENPTIRDLASPAIFRPPSGQGLTVEGRPLLNASFALNYAWSGLDVGSYHGTNLAIHLAAGLALLGLVRRTLTLATSPAELRSQALAVALVVAAGWTLHPVQTESVTYVVQRAESLMGALVWFSLYAFVRGAAPGGSRGWMGASVVAAWLGVTAKEVAAIIPILALLYDRAFLAGGFAAAWRQRQRVHLALFGCWLPLAALIVASGSRGGTVGFGSNVSWWDYALTQAEAIPRYLALALWPVPLIFDYGTVWVKSVGDVLPGLVLVATLVVGFFVTLFRWPAWAVLGALLLGPLAPTSLIPGNRQTMAEHRMYLPLAAVMITVVCGATYLLRRNGDARRAGLGSRETGFSRWAGRISGWSLAAVFVLSLGMLTRARNVVYASELSLQRDTVAKRPENGHARYNLGKCLAEAGAPAAAVEEYRAAIRLMPGFALAHYNLGNALEELGRPAEAEKAFRSALQLAPAHVRSHYNLGNLLARSGRRAEAKTHFAEAVRLAPDFLDAQMNLGSVLLDLGQLDEARKQFEWLIRSSPGASSATAHLNLGHVHRLQGRAADARAEFERALRLAPGFGPAEEALRRLGSGR